jgi:hypothetical protein
VSGTPEEAATNLQNLLSKMNSQETIKNFAKFGVDLPAALKKAAADGRSPIEEIVSLTRKVAGGDGVKLGKLFNDMQVQAAMRGLLQHTDYYRQVRADALRAQNVVENTFRRRLGDADVQQRALAASAQALGHRIGNDLLPVASSFMAKASEIALAVSDWADRHPQLTSALVKLAALLALSLGTLGSLALAIGTVLGPFAVLRFAVTSGVPGLRMLGVGLRFVASGFLRVAAAMLLNPWGLAIAGLVAFAFAVYNHWDGIKARFLSLVPTFKWIGGLLMEGLLAPLNPLRMIEAVGKLANAAVTKMKSALGIRSPSRVFAEIGGHVSAGLAGGIDRGRHAPVERLRAISAKMAGAIAVGGAAPAIAAGGGQARPPAITAPAPISGPITIVVQQQPGQSGDQLARAVALELDKLRRGDAAARRSAYVDDDA